MAQSEVNIQEHTHTAMNLLHREEAGRYEHTTAT